MSSVPDGFLTSPVIEYVRLFPTSFLVSTFFFFFLLFGCLAADNFDVFSILRFFFCLSFSLFVRLLPIVVDLKSRPFCAGVAAKLPKSCSALAPVEVFFTFSLTNSVLVVFSVAFDKPITFILIWLLCFRMCFMPETS